MWWRRDGEREVYGEEVGVFEEAGVGAGEEAEHGEDEGGDGAEEGEDG